MSSAEVVVQLPSAVKSAAVIGQATAVEQARAVAEVQAAIVVAQNVPRDMERALGEMRDTCGRMALAQRAFYEVTNRGNGPSVHLARELARIWGNIQYGVHELRRDDDAGISEIQSFAWDCQTNTRSTRTFVVPHARMKGGGRQKLVDLTDIYLSNQNVGARAVRECIFSVLPTWFTEEAQDRCHATLEKGEGAPLEQRITNMIATFGNLGITVAQMEAKLGRKRGAWTAADVAQMTVAHTSITRDGIDKAELFPPAQQRVTAAEIKQQAPAPTAGPKLSKGQLIAIHTAFKELGMGGEDEDVRAGRLEYIASLGINVTSTKDLTEAQAATVLDALDERVAGLDA
jgi:hypothetical protein